MQIWLISSSSDEFENFEEIPCHLTLIQPWDLDIINNFSIYLFSHCTLKPFEKFKKVSVIFFNIRLYQISTRHAVKDALHFWSKLIISSSEQ